MKPSLVTLTIGQAPRHDIMPLISRYLPLDKVSHVGLLDGLNALQVTEQYGATDSDSVLASRLADGTPVFLAVSKVEWGLQHKIEQLEAKDYRYILLLCTGIFHHLQTQKALLLTPDRIIPPLIAAMAGDRRVGIVLPVSTPRQNQVTKWAMLAHSPCVAIVNPYQENAQSLGVVASTLQKQGVEVVVLDCIGYRYQHRDFLQKKLIKPVLLSNVLIAKLAAELIM
ncbi:aroM family protein [Yersinia ruckeri]|uniref:AroM family protein n=1 Tax=Yersinia ruckeri TaxID=29486 RepID=UPI0005ABF785|nr:AroM family protein [Yersinia ruckeri]AJI94968.1 aroM family protein [Yersinia ruckeri]MCW6567606.1 AroM family protein [Yersinia ruckeri]